VTDPARRLAEAGADNLLFNAPLGVDRADHLADLLVHAGASAMVDLGCGKGAMARTIAARHPTVTVVGVEIDAALVDRARQLTEADGLADRVTYAVADASEWTGEVDAAVCVGASHAFGGTSPMFDRLAVVVGSGVALIGEGYWAEPPSDWCREIFGELPDGLDGLVSSSVAAGWTVEHAESSTLTEWDEFEHGWCDGVRAVGTTEAAAFADERADEYLRYRGVLGFGWLVLRRS
jgi:SAM-dependent methyltransferase